MERKTGFEPATSTLARLRSSQLSYFRASGIVIVPPAQGEAGRPRVAPGDTRHRNHDR